MVRAARTFASLALLALLACSVAASGCRCGKGETKIGEKRAFACAEVPSKDAKSEVDLGDGKRLVRDGVRVELRGVAPDAPVAVLSFDGGASELALSPDLAAVFVVGLGALPREPLARALGALAKKVPLVVVVAGPEDEIDQVRAALADGGPRVVDGGVLRIFALAGLELVTLPGSDDPSTLPDHGRGCVLRRDDAQALAAKLGISPPQRPRLVLSWAAPSRGKDRPVAADALSNVTGWIIAGPLDRDVPAELVVAAGASSVLVPTPRASIPRTTSTPSLVPPGWLVVRADPAQGGPGVSIRRMASGS